MNEKKLTPQEIAFKTSIENKIRKHEIPTNFKECLTKAKNQFIETIYSDKTTELVDVGIEHWLCYQSPLYFIESYGLVEIPGIGVLSCRNNLFYFQREMLKQFKNYKKIVATKSRQIGGSFISSCYVFWAMLFLPRQNVAIISKDQKSSEDYLKKIKLNLDTIPNWLNVRPKDNNVRSISFTNGASCYAYARSKSAGRSASLSLCILDEAAFYGTETLIDSIVSSVSMALSKDPNSLLFVISTPSGTIGQGKWYYEQVTNLEMAGGEIKSEKARLFAIDWWMVRSPNPKLSASNRGYEKEVEEFEKRDYFNNFNVLQDARKFFAPIEKDWKRNVFLKTQHELLGEVLFRQEVLHSFEVTGQTVFTKDILDEIDLKIKSPILKDVLGHRHYKGLWIWKEPIVDGKYILAADCAVGSGLDDSSFQVLDANTYEQVCEFSAKVTTYDYAPIIYNVASYYNDAYVVVEQNGIGEAVMNKLYYELNYHNMYHTIKSVNGVNRAVSWTTTVQNRDLITGKLVEMLYDEENLKNFKIYSSRLSSQLKTWVYSDSGRIDHKKGQHDDTIISLCIALHLINKAARDNISFFVDEQGNNIGAGSENNRNINNEQMYKDVEKKMLEDANVPDRDTLKWLLG